MKLLAVFFAALLLALAPARAAEAPASAPARIRVLVKPAEPFSFEKDGKITGYSVELWNRIAEESGLQFDLKMVKTMPELLAALQSGQGDVGVGAISITQEREKVLDFSHNFFESGLQILAPGQHGSSSFAIFASLFRGDVLFVVLIFLLAIFIVSNILWLAERKHNEEVFPKAYKSGVWEACWWAASTIISGGCENKSTTTVPGRLVAVVWMLGGIGLTSYITATLASAMTVNTLTSDIRSLNDLKGQTIGTVAGTSAESFLKARGFSPKTFPDLNTAIAEVEKKNLHAVIYDSPMLRYYLSTHPDSPLQLAGDLFERQNYGLALPLGSPYRKRINEALLKLQIEGFHADLEKKWFAANTPN